MNKQTIKETLINLLTTPEKELRTYILVYFLNKGYEVLHEEANNYIHLTHKEKKDYNPVLFAHLDTVSDSNVAPLRQHLEIKQTWDLRGNETETISLSPEAPSTIKCLGGDDRAGVAAIMAIIDGTVQRPDIIFTYAEEVGSIGAKKYLSELNEFKAPYLLQFDRRNDDIVFYSCLNEDFQKTITGLYDKPKGNGSTTDIKHFQEKFKINSANISVGFKSEHTRSETVNLAFLHKAIDGTILMLRQPRVQKLLGTFEWTVKAPTYTYSYGNYSYGKSATTTTTTTTTAAKTKDTQKKAPNFPALKKYFADSVERLVVDSPFIVKFMDIPEEKELTVFLKETKVRPEVTMYVTREKIKDEWKTLIDCFSGAKPFAIKDAHKQLPFNTVDEKKDVSDCRKVIGIGKMLMDAGATAFVGITVKNAYKKLAEILHNESDQ